MKLYLCNTCSKYFVMDDKATTCPLGHENLSEVEQSEKYGKGRVVTCSNSQCSEFLTATPGTNQGDVWGKNAACKRCRKKFTALSDLDLEQLSLSTGDAPTAQVIPGLKSAKGLLGQTEKWERGHHSSRTSDNKPKNLPSSKSARGQRDAKGVKADAHQKEKWRSQYDGIITDLRNWKAENPDAAFEVQKECNEVIKRAKIEYARLAGTGYKGHAGTVTIEYPDEDPIPTPGDSDEEITGEAGEPFDEDDGDVFISKSGSMFRIYMNYCQGEINKLEKKPYEAARYEGYIDSLESGILLKGLKDEYDGFHGDPAPQNEDDD
jgi:hypothetical protein